MKVLIATDSVKGSMTAFEACHAIHEGIKNKAIETRLCPLSDGGDGVIDVLVFSNNAEEIVVDTIGPLGQPIKAGYVIDWPSATAIVEVAEAAGIVLLKYEELNPMITTTYGVGALILDAIDKGCRKIIICVGGTGTNDGGMGLLSALGVKFLDKRKKELPGCGASLTKLRTIDVESLNPKLVGVEFVIASDVQTPVCGPRGAAIVYSPQKGATPSMVKTLDKGLANYANILSKMYNIEAKELVGGGCGGGLGLGLQVILKAEHKQGFDVVDSYVGLEEKIKWADLVITGEGKIDEQTLDGKVPYRVAKLAKKYNKRVIGLCGKNELNKKIEEFDEIYSISEISKEVGQAALQHGYRHLKRLASRLSF